MLILLSQTNNPALNLATEQYLVETKKYPVPIVFLWQNENTIVVGRNQNTAAEINFGATERDQVQVVRRNTGGGTVFHDLGNLCFSLIVEKTSDLDPNQAFQNCLMPVLTLLKKYGIAANFKGRNDLEVAGQKISGNAQLQTNDKILTHGTLLFDVDLTKIQQYLNPNLVKMNSKKVKSVSARVTNIKPLIKPAIEINEFKQELVKIYQQNQTSQDLVLDEQDWSQIQKIAHEKYQNWAWNYGKNETFTWTNQLYFPQVGLIEANLITNEGRIDQIKFYGDFLGSAGSEELESKMQGLNYDLPTIQKVLNTVDLTPIFGAEIQANMLIELLFS